MFSAGRVGVGRGEAVGSRREEGLSRVLSSMEFGDGGKGKGESGRTRREGPLRVLSSMVFGNKEENGNGIIGRGLLGGGVRGLERRRVTTSSAKSGSSGTLLGPPMSRDDARIIFSNAPDEPEALECVRMDGEDDSGGIGGSLPRTVCYKKCKVKGIRK